VSAAARCCRIDADSGQEVINGAGGRINGNPRHRAPALAIGGGTYHDVVRSAARAEATIRPHHKYLACAVDAGGRQIGISYPAGIQVAVDAGDRLALAPALAAIRGTEHVDAAALKRHDDRAIGLHQRLTAQPARVVRGGQAWAPGLPAIARNAHQNITASVSLIPLRVAI